MYPSISPSTGETLADSQLDFTRILYMQYLEMDNTIRHADLKAQLIMGINALLVVALTGESFVDVSGIFDGDTSFGVRISLMLQVVMLVSLLGSVFYALSTILPRFKTAEHSGNLFFFGSIIHFAEDDYLERFSAMSHDDVKAAVLAQIRAKSFIAHTKFRKIRLSLFFLFGAVILWGVVTLLPAT